MRSLAAAFVAVALIAACAASDAGMLGDNRDGWNTAATVIGGPEEGPDVIPCPALCCPDANVVHVALQLDEIEVAHLAQGGTLWLTTWGGLPIHLLEVQPPERGR